MTDWSLYAQELSGQARQASRDLAQASGARKNAWILATAAALEQNQADILAANEQDLAAAPGYGLSAAAIDRLKLTPARLASLASALREIVLLPDPVGEEIEGYRRPNGLVVTRRRVPLGVVFFIYESRPNVTLDAAALCVKSGNAVILRGGKEAIHSNRALFRLLQTTLSTAGLPVAGVQLVESTDRDVVGALLRCRNNIDVAIPRGGKSLIERVATEATMPVIKHFDGICHVYVDRSANVEMAVEILRNSKCQRTGVCNAAESLLVHADVVPEFWNLAGQMLQQERVQVRGCQVTRAHWPWAVAATEADYRTEYLDLIVSAKVVPSLDAAIEHIEVFGSQHTDTIVTQDLQSAETFLNRVDSSAVLVNASTRFNDGGELGLGAEIGISTDKFHARGPCGLRELTSYKWVVRGTGQVRS